MLSSFLIPPVFILSLRLFLYCVSVEAATTVGFGVAGTMLPFFSFMTSFIRALQPPQYPPSVPPKSPPTARQILATSPRYVITTWKSGEGNRKVLISVGLWYRYGPGNKWPNAPAAEKTINKAISCVITAALFLKLTFQNFSPCKSLQPHH